MQSISSAKKPGPLAKCLKKSTGATTVSVEFLPADGELNEVRLSSLSMQLRKAKTASIWVTKDKPAALMRVKLLAEEQMQAKGSFPGPCPVVYNSKVADPSELEAAVSVGASAVTISLGDVGVEKTQEIVNTAAQLGLETVVGIRSTDQIDEMLKCEPDVALVAAQDIEETVAIIKALGADKIPMIAQVEAMQKDARERDTVQRIKEAGCKAILLRGACVGDSEDLEYTKWAVEAFNSKLSKEFGKMTGMTVSMTDMTRDSPGAITGVHSRIWKRKQLEDL
eukprot:749938-Hanusia_phi.AAC.4